LRHPTTSQHQLSEAILVIVLIVEGREVEDLLDRFLLAWQSIEAIEEVEMLVERTL